MTNLCNELNTLSNQDLVQVIRASIPTVSNIAEQMLAKRGGYIYDIAEIDNRLSDIYIKHLEVKFA